MARVEAPSTTSEPLVSGIPMVCCEPGFRPASAHAFAPMRVFGASGPLGGSDVTS